MNQPLDAPVAGDLRTDFSALYMPPSARPTLNKAVTEADTMRAMAELLAALPDSQSRARVLKWCHEQFGGDRPGVRPNDDQNPGTPSGGHVGDPALTIGEDVFDTPRQMAHDPGADEVKVDLDNASETVHCDRLELDTALFEEDPIDADALFVSGVDITEANAEQPNKPVGLESVLRDFVAEFQRFALAWRTA